MTGPRPLLAVAAAALLGALAWAYQDTFRWILQGWRENPYFSHGPLVPLISGYLLWRNRHALAALPWRTWWPGLALVVLAALLFVGGRVADVHFVVGVSLVVLAHGLVLLLGGPEVYRGALFPLTFLVFAVPLSQLLIQHYTFPLQLLSARLATMGIGMLAGADAHAEGTLMRMDGLEYMVAAECSGFKALLGLTMVGILVAYLTDTTPARKVAIALLAAPIAVASNVVRLLSVLVVGRVWGHTFAVTTFHDASGIVMLVVAIAILLGVARLIVGPEADIAAPPAEVDGPPRWQVGWQPLLAAAAAALAYGATGLALVPPEPPAPNVDLHAVPLTIGAWKGEELKIDPRVNQELGDVAIIQRAYVRDPKDSAAQVIVICGRGRRSLHPPASCYVGAGHEILQEKETLIPVADGRLHFERLVVGDNGHPTMVALYTFTDGTTTTPDYAQHQSRSLQRGQVIWTQLHFAAPWRGSTEATEAWLTPFIAEAWPAIRDTLPKAEKAGK